VLIRASLTRRVAPDRSVSYDLNTTINRFQSVIDTFPQAERDILSRVLRIIPRVGEVDEGEIVIAKELDAMYRAMNPRE